MSVLTVHRRWLVPLVVSLGTLLLAIWWLVGEQVSPRTEAGRPVIYTPGVRAVVRYRREAGRWATLLVELEQEMATLLDEPAHDPYTLSGRVDLLLAGADQLVETVGSRKAPPSLMGLQELCETAAIDTLAAVEAVGRWAGAPAGENAAAAWDALELARDSQETLSSSPWLLENDNGDQKQPAAVDAPWGK